MGDHMEAAVKIVAKHMSETALDWTDVESDGHEHDLECTNWGAYTGDALTALEAALPHIRAMIAQEIREEERIDRAALLPNTPTTITQEQLEESALVAHSATPNGIGALETGTTNGLALIFAETLLTALGIEVEK